MMRALNLLPEHSLASIVDILVRFVEAAGALVIFLGAAIAVVRFAVIGARSRSAEAFVPVRLGLGRFLELGLEFQLASDVLRTAIAPSFREIGQLAAVATIRTALNYFLSREIIEERQQLERKHAGAPDLTQHPAAAAPRPWIAASGATCGSTVTLAQLLDSCALLVTAAGLSVGALVLGRTGHIAPALAALLELLTAAGLLRLAAAPTLARALAAGGILLVRRVATLGLRSSSRH